MVSCKWLAPIFEHTRETAIHEMGFDLIYHHISKAEPSHSSANDHVGAVECKSAINADLYLLSSFFQLLGIKGTRRRQAEVDTWMIIGSWGLRGIGCLLK